MRSSHKKGRLILFTSVIISALTINGTVFAGEYFKELTGWGLSRYELPGEAEQSSTGVEITDSEDNAYDGRGALHIWSGGTKATGYISCAATKVDELEVGKTYRLTGMIKTSQVSWGRPALTLGDTNIATNLASGLEANKWCEFSKEFTFSEGSSKELRIQMWNTGEVYLDNVSLKEVTNMGFGEELLENVGFEKDYIRVYTTPIVIKDDSENIIVGASSEMEYSVDEGSTWKAYDENNTPDFSGNIDVLIRYTEDPDKEKNVLRLNFTENVIEKGNFTVSLFEIKKNEFKVEGTLKDAENEKVNILLVREGESKRSLENIILVSVFETDENGKFSFTAPIADFRGAMKNDGWYTMYLKSHDTEIHDFNKVYFACFDTRSGAIDLLKSGDTSKYFDETNEMYHVFNSIGFALSDYVKPGVDKTRAVSIFEAKVAQLGNSLNEENATEEFSKAVFLSATGEKNETTMYELLKKYGNKFSFKYGEDVTLEKVLTDGNAMAWISKYFSLKSAQTPAEAVKLFNESYALYLINNATYGEMADVIKAQENYLSLGGTDYDKYMSFNNSGNSRVFKISKYIVSESAKQPFTDATQVLSAISSGVAESSRGDNSGGVSGGSTGGSSGGKGNTVGAGAGSANVVKPVMSDVDYFEDLEGYSWAKDAINKLFEKEIVNGKSTRIFAPQDMVTRQEFVKIVVNLTDSYDEAAECEFEDVDKKSWYYKYVASAVKSGLILGVSDTEFGTDLLITREQIAVIANRILNKESDEYNDIFADDEKIGEYAKEAVYNIRKKGIISGYEDNTFRPQNPATRAETAVICFNLLNKR